MHSACRGYWRCPRVREPAGTNTQMQATCMMSEGDTLQHDMVVHFTHFTPKNGGKRETPWGRRQDAGVRIQPFLHRTSAAACGQCPRPTRSGDGLAGALAVAPTGAGKRTPTAAAGLAQVPHLQKLPKLVSARHAACPSPRRLEYMFLLSMDPSSTSYYLSTCIRAGQI